jgi:hypothetical protein
MKLNKIALVGGGVAFAFGAMVVAACSSSTPNAVVPPGGGNDGGQQAQGDSGNNNTNPDSGNNNTNPDSGNNNTNPDGGTGGDSGSTVCAKPPALHIPEADGGVYCPFSYNNATDAGIQYCSGATPQCCVSPASDAGPSDCEAVGACKDSTFKTWQCSAPSDCAGYPVDGGGEPVVCCLISGAIEADPACTGYQKTKGLDSVSCAPASQCVGPITIGKYMDVHYVACEQQSDCTASAAAFGGDGGTCTAVKTSGTPIGLCL